METTTTYHWVLTLGGVLLGRQATAGLHGTVRLPQGDSRSAVYDELRTKVLADIQARAGAPLENVCTLFWSLEPDRL